MAQRLQEYCAIAVEENLGQICAQIFTTLSEQGRMSIAQLRRFTSLPSRQLRYSLTVMVQQHVLRYHTDDNDITRYSIDWRSSYNLTRSNRIISIVDERYGEGAARIITNLLQLGHARVGDLAQAFDLETAKRDSGIADCNEHVNGVAKTNGTDTTQAHKSHGSKITTVGQFHSTLHTLLQAGFLVKLHKRAYLPAADLQDEMEEIIISQDYPDRKINGPKKQAEFKKAVNKLKRKHQEDEQFSERHDFENRGTFHSSAKRPKTNGVHTNGTGHGDHDENVPRLPNEMVLRVNYAQCTLALRSQRLEQLAEPSLGPVTATVYGALLRVLETKLKGRDDIVKAPTADGAEEDDDDDLPVGTTIEVADMLEPGLALGLGIFDKKKKLKPTQQYPGLDIKEEVLSDDEDVSGYAAFYDKNKRLSLVEEHLKLLEEHPKTFCRRIGGGGRGEWRVSFYSLTDTLIQAEIDSTVLARFGNVHMRFVRLLRERGRIEEKQIAAVNMMRIKDVRAILTQLQYVGIVESQEVPRDNSRMAGRTAFLWFHDQRRVQNLLLQQTYQGMSRTLQRLQHERETNKNVIEKAEMADVKQDSLSQTEKDAVTQWRELEEKMIVQVQRMDELVAVLRDYSGKDTSLVS